MGDLFSPRLAILSSWNSTLQVAFQTFRRIKFVVEDTFSFGDFDPQVVFSGLTGAAASHVTGRAKFLKVFKFLWISFDIRFTASIVSSTNSISIIVPANLANGGSTSQQAGSCFIMLETLPFLPEAGVWYNDIISGSLTGMTGQNRIVMSRGAGSYFTTDPTRVSLNAFMEIQ